MDNSINRTNLNSSGAGNTNFEYMPKDASELKLKYENFVKQMDKSDFCNSPRRYIAELIYVQRLKELYFEYNCQDLLKEMTNRETFISEKLKNEFGITSVQ